MAAILNSGILVFPLKFTHTCQDLFPLYAHKKTSLIHSDSTWWWQPYWILPSWILVSLIQQFCTKLWLKLIQSDSNSFILTQLDDVSHLEFCLLDSTIMNKKNFTHSFLLNLMMAAILNSTILDSAILIFPLKLTHTCQDWFPPFAHKKTSVIHSDSTWWWQPSWNLPCWIQTLPSWIQTPCYLLSDSHKNTLTPLWLWLKLISIWLIWWWQPSLILPSWIQPFCTKLWLKLIQSDSDSFILT